MGLFGGHKCSFCGADRGFLGNTTLKDGNLCDDCRKQLSPLFRVNDQTTVAEVTKHLSYRKQNQARLEQFAIAEQIALEEDSIYLDKQGKQLFIAKTSREKSANPDIIPFAGIQDVSSRFEKEKTPIQWKNQAGEAITCDPPMYHTTYNVSLVITLENENVSGQQTLRLATDLDSSDCMEAVNVRARLDEIAGKLNSLKNA